VDGTGSGSCQIAGFGIRGVETSGSVSHHCHLVVSTAKHHLTADVSPV
jgi:hypothetical protein